MATYLYPGVYIEEIPSGAKPIEGVDTSVAAFIGAAKRGPLNEPTPISKWDDYVTAFGGVTGETDAMGLALQAFYLNGGKRAYIGRLASNAIAATSGAIHGVAKVLDTSGNEAAGETASAKTIDVLEFSAKSKGKWGDDLLVNITDNNDGYSFDVEIGRLDEDGDFQAEETFSNLTMNERDANYVVSTIAANSGLATVAVGDVSGKFIKGYSAGTVDVSGWTTASTWDGLRGKELTLNIDGMGDVTLKISDNVGSWAGANNGIKNDLETQVIGIGDAAGYAGFKVTKVTIGTEDIIKLTSGSTASNSSVVVKGGDAATLLGLGKGAGGSEVHGSAHVIPATTTDAVSLSGGDDGSTPGAADYQSFFSKLEKVRDVNIIVLPGVNLPASGGNPIVARAVAHCEKTKSRMVIIDPPPSTELTMASQVDGMSPPTSTYTVMYYPWVKVANPFYHAEKNPAASKTLNIAPSAFAAGMWSKIDGKRGVWKAPAGVETNLLGVAGLEYDVDNNEQGVLNPLGVNCLRKLPGYGSVIWGARTLSTKADPEWRYVPVRRTAIMLEQSIYNGIQWAVFEPNDHRLWASLRTNISAFMDGLFRAGAFQGEKASDAYFVRCNLGDTMTQGDIDRGQVIAIVGFAPLKPAEFVIIRIQQKAGQNQ